MAAAVVGAVLGDTVGYEVGRRYGDRLLARATRRLVRPEAVERARLVIVRRGGPAVLVGRFTAALRALVPGIAGTSRMPYRTFAAWNVAGGVLWGTAFSVLGFLAGRSYRLLERRVGSRGACSRRWRSSPSSSSSWSAGTAPAPVRRPRVELLSAGVVTRRSVNNVRFAAGRAIASRPTSALPAAYSTGARQRPSLVSRTVSKA
jgi:hypothetical protein